MLSAIHEMFQDVVGSNWQTEVDTWSKRIKLFREYHEGDHRSTITSEMAELLRIDDTAVLDRLNANYMQKVTDAMVDRLTVTGITVDKSTADGVTEDPRQAWVDELLHVNRWDELETDVTESYCIDGDAFLMVSWDEDEGRTCLTQELAYNGDWGMIPIYARADRRNLYAAVKIVGMGDDDYLVYVYYRDRVATYLAMSSGGGLAPYVMEPEKPGTGEAPHIQPYGGDVDVFPVIHYANRRNKSTGLGVSELMNAIPLNDVINRTIQSMVAASELSAFQVAYIIGAEAKTRIKPGTIIEIGPEGIPEDYKMPQVGTLAQNSPVPFLEVIMNMIWRIADVTSTPIYMSGSSQSGEALKQLEIALLAKLRRAMVKIGNRHEDVVSLAERVTRLYGAGTAVPEIGRVSCQWRDAQVRNDKEVVDNAKVTYDVTNDIQLYLESITEVEGWSTDERTEILKRIETARRDVLNFTMASTPELNFGAVLDQEEVASA